MTLVEVLAGMAILGSLLTGIVLAQARLTVQSRRTMQRRQACQLAEGLLSLWWEDEVIIPRNSSGNIADPPGWRWLTYVYYTDEADDLGAEVMRLNLFGPGSAENETTLSIEILLPRLETDEDGNVIEDQTENPENQTDTETKNEEDATQEGPDIN